MGCRLVAGAATARFPPVRAESPSAGMKQLAVAPAAARRPDL